MANKELLLSELQALQAELPTIKDPVRLEYVRKRLQEIRIMLFKMNSGL